MVPARLDLSGLPSAKVVENTWCFFWSHLHQGSKRAERILKGDMQHCIPPIGIAPLRNRAVRCVSGKSVVERVECERQK